MYELFIEFLQQKEFFFSQFVQYEHNYYFFDFSEYYEQYESLSCFLFSSCSKNNFVLTVGTIKKVSFFLMFVTDMLSMNFWQAFDTVRAFWKKIRVRAVWTRYFERDCYRVRAVNFFVFFWVHSMRPHTSSCSKKKHFFFVEFAQ